MIDISTRPLGVILAFFTASKPTNSQGHFHASILSQANTITLTRINSTTARRIRVKTFSDLKRVDAPRRFTLKNDESIDISITFNSRIFGAPKIRLTWFESFRRFSTEIEIQSVGVY